MVNEELFTREGEPTSDPGKVMKGIRWTNEISKQYAFALGTVVEGIVKTDNPAKSSLLIDAKIDLAIKRLVNVKNKMPPGFKDTMAEQRVEDMNRAVVEMFKGFQARIKDGEFETPQKALMYYKKNVIKQAARSFDTLFGTSVRKDILKAAGY